MKLDDPFLGKAQVHAFCVLQVEGTLVQLGDGVVGIQQRRLLVYLSNDLKEIKRHITNWKETGDGEVDNKGEPQNRRKEHDKQRK